MGNMVDEKRGYQIRLNPSKAVLFLTLQPSMLKNGVSSPTKGDLSIFIIATVYHRRTRKSYITI